MFWGFFVSFDTLGTLKKPLASLALRHQLPRAAVQVRKARFDVITPDMGNISDFDPYSPQEWARSAEAWTGRERVAIAMFAVLGRI